MSKILKTSYFLIGFTILFSIIFQIFYFIAENNFELVNFFSLFTIQSNLLASIVLIVASNKSNQTIDYLRGLATLTVMIAGLGFFLLLGGVQDYLLITVNLILHYLSPIALLVMWLINPPSAEMPIKRTLSWLIYPFVYFIYSIIRGEIINWYAYDFFNPSISGVSGVITNFLIILIGSLAIIWFLSITKKKIKKTAPKD